MGCDIHLFVEVKHNGRWLTYNQPNVGRNYDLFERMAGVRGEVSNAMVEPRGLPDDISEVALACYQAESDLHTPSWLNRDEIELLKGWYHDNILTDQHFYDDFGYMLGEGFEDVRFVFWFDN